jgi:hypothetical protein
MYSGQKVVNNGHCTVDSGQWTGGCGQEQWATNTGQWALGSEHCGRWLVAPESGQLI